ncbi:homeobox protein vab-15 [Nematostella vectensis]|uniref:homeobox protein vab-15 n=1 Tax=Nematostella vectensis TaxID=45351 RepID=UPI00207730B9|nr:homeobox protein vab-15 [Nematostella vectensis]
MASTVQLPQPSLITRQDLEQRKIPFTINDILLAVTTASSNSSLSSQPSPPLSVTESDSSAEKDSNPQTPDSDPAPDKSTKPRRSFFSTDQVNQLERVFAAQQYVSAKERAEIAERFNMTDEQVKNWFQNRRMKRKRKRAEETEYYIKLALYNTSIGPQPNQGFRPYPGPPPVLSPQVYRGYPFQYPGTPPPPMYPAFPPSFPFSPPPKYPGLPVSSPGRVCNRPDCNCGGRPLNEMAAQMYGLYP